MRKRRQARTPLPVAAMQRGYNTNLASEFYVLSMLYRLGFDANLTLGNKKSVDIAVVLGPGCAITVDVKAVAGKMDWLMGSSPDSPKPNHYVVLVSYDGRFGDAQQAPRCWVLRHDEILPLVKTANGKGRMRYLSRKQVLDGFGFREGAWQLLGETPAFVWRGLIRGPSNRRCTRRRRWSTRLIRSVGNGAAGERQPLTASCSSEDSARMWAQIDSVEAPR